MYVSKGVARQDKMLVESEPKRETRQLTSLQLCLYSQLFKKVQCHIAVLSSNKISMVIAHIFRWHDSSLADTREKDRNKFHIITHYMQASKMRFMRPPGITRNVCVKETSQVRQDLARVKDARREIDRAEDRERWSHEIDRFEKSIGRKELDRRNFWRISKERTGWNDLIGR